MLKKTDSEPYGFGILKWVSSEYLENNLEKYSVLDTQPNVHDYFMAHLPNARFLNESTLRCPEKGLPARYIEPENAVKLFSRVGLEPSKPIVVYTAKGGFKKWGDGLEQCMMAYSLMRMGHRNVYLLDGGMDKWIKENRPISQKFPNVDPTNFKLDLKSDYYVDMDAIKNLIDDDETVILDARPHSFYTGEEGPWIKNGHIPGSISFPWADLMTSENKTQLKPIHEIIEKAENAEITKDKQVICSCGTGREATNEFTIFKHLLNYPKVKLFEGAFTEWSSHPENTIITGKKPK